MHPAQLLSRVGFSPPKWALGLRPPQHGRVLLGHLPTPLMPWACPALKELDVQWWLKRDDMSGMELTGNKVRKLEFLMAEALSGQHDCVVTVGGVQSNHCRATAAAARLLGLQAHIILLVSETVARTHQVGLAGNLLFDRLTGAKLHLCPASVYRQEGGDLEAMDRLCERLCQDLRSVGRNPYIVPVGGTAPLSAWAYINAVQELQEQIGNGSADGPAEHFDHIVFAIGSGGTATGLALGCSLSGISESCELHGVNVQHSPELFYDSIASEAAALGVKGATAELARKWLTLHDGSGLAYGHANDELLRMIREVGISSGVLLDHVYAGKALQYFCQAALKEPERYRGKKILFWHTGGQLGLFAKEQQFAEMLDPNDLQTFAAPPLSKL